MTAEGKLIEIKVKLIDYAKRSTWEENEDGTTDEYFNPMECSGGNYDDAYYGGKKDGETEIARDIIKMINAPE